MRVMYISHILLSNKNKETSLSLDGSPEEGDEEEGEEDQVAPPDDWVAQQVDSLIVAGEKLTLKRINYLYNKFVSFCIAKTHYIIAKRFIFNNYNIFWCLGLFPT